MADIERAGDINLLFCVNIIYKYLLSKFSHSI